MPLMSVLSIYNTFLSIRMVILIQDTFVENTNSLEEEGDVPPVSIFHNCILMGDLGFLNVMKSKAFFVKMHLRSRT